MKRSIKIIFIGGMLLQLFIPSLVQAQGTLAPPSGTPEPTMKSLQEIWDKMESLQETTEALQAVVAAQYEAIKQLNAVVDPPFLLPMVTIGNAGNPDDDVVFEGDVVFGSVDYVYSMGKYEVTNTQYVHFLNAVAAEDPNELYDPLMGFNTHGGIIRSGSPGSYRYKEIDNMGDKPVVYILWSDAARFCNWLHNGRPTGAQDSSTTEDGAYTLNGLLTVAEGSDPLHGANGRNEGAKFFVPSEDEWYKAAYHKFILRGRRHSYSVYATNSDEEPTSGVADEIGVIGNRSDNVANYKGGAKWGEMDENYFTTVGSGGDGNASFYGVFDMSGNILEWIEEPFNIDVRTVRGGHFASSAEGISSASRSFSSTRFAASHVGFRIAGSASGRDSIDKGGKDPGDVNVGNG